MLRTTLFGIFAVLAAGASLAACGSDTGSAGTTTGDGGSGSTTSSTTATSGSGTTATGTGGGGPTLVNGCDPTALVDHTMDATVEIKFGDMVGYEYAPPCIKVKSGTMVTFTGNTAVHPLAPGEVITGAIPVVDDKSPIKSTVNGPASVTFAVAPAGSYPYFCTEHYSAGMKGLIVAE